jgi:hypothetical protein
MRPRDPQHEAEVAARLELLGLTCDGAPGRVAYPAGRLPPDPTAPLRHPHTGAPLGDIVLAVEADGMLAVVGPADIVGVPPVPLHAVATSQALRAELAERIETRGSHLRDVHTELRELGLDVEPITHLAGFRAARVLDGIGTVTVVVEEKGVRLLELRTAASPPAHVPLEGELDVAAHATGEALDLHLTAVAARALARTARSGHERDTGDGASTVRRPTVTLLPQGPRAVTLGWLLDALGPELAVNGQVWLSRPLSVDETPGTLRLLCDAYGVFTHAPARLCLADRTVWEGVFPLARLPSLSRWVARVLEERERADRGAPSRPAEGEPLPPAVGEVWVMDVQVISESAHEVRYVALNRSGERAGAPRVLPKADFAGVFVPCGARHRLQVRVASVSPDSVGYARLDAERSPTGGAREVALAIFLSSFVPEPVGDTAQ